MLSGTGLELVREHPNLMPVLSIEGGADVTDARRGEGTYSALRRAMSALSDESLPFGCSVTVQKSNLHEVMGADFVAELARRGCKVIIYVEYVPVDRATEEQAPRSGGARIHGGGALCTPRGIPGAAARLLPGR